MRPHDIFPKFSHSDHALAQLPRLGSAYQLCEDTAVTSRTASRGYLAAKLEDVSNCGIEQAGGYFRQCEQDHVTGVLLS
jgi:hypothetical protein